MSKVLVLYSTTDGHTQTIAQRLRERMQAVGHTVQVVNMHQAHSLKLDIFDTLVIGASIRYGKHAKAVYDFVLANKAVLESKHTAFFSVNLVARKPEKCQPNSNPYFQKFLRKVQWQPKLQAVFAGEIHYAKYSFWDKHMIRFIMWITNGPIDTAKVIDFTDWRQVDDFALRIGKL